MKMIGRTWAVYLYNNNYMLSVHYDARTWFLSKFYFRHISKNSAEFNILVMNGIWLILFVFIICKALQQKLIDLCILMICRIINWCFGRGFWLVVFVWIILFHPKRCASGAEEKLILYLMWTLVNILSARVVVFGYYVALDQCQTSIWFNEFEIIVLES